MTGGGATIARFEATPGERAFALAVVRSFVHAEGAEAAASTLGFAAHGVESWSRLQPLLARHRIAAVAYRVLSRPQVWTACRLPEPVLADLRKTYSNAFVRVTRDPRALHEAIGALAEAGIPALTIKGLVVGAWLYDDPTLRQYDDLDLLVSVEHAGAADRVLRELGYRTTETPSQLAPMVANEELAPGVSYQRPLGLSLDLTFDPLRLFWTVEPGTSGDFADWWDRRQEVRVGRETVPTLGSEDQFIHLSRHMQFHEYNRLAWFLDVALVLRDHGDRLDWDMIGRTARDRYLHPGLYRTLELMRHGFGVAGPDAAWRALRPNPVIARVHRRLWPDAFVLPRDYSSRGGNPITPRLFSFGSAKPMTTLVLFASDPQRGRNARYLLRRYVPTRAWLRQQYRAETGSDRYAALLRAHWRFLVTLRERTHAETGGTRRRPRGGRR